MAMVRDPSPALCHDEAFIDFNHTGVEYMQSLHHPDQFVAESLVGSHHPWDFPMPCSPGRLCTIPQDGGWETMSAGVVSSSSPSSSVVTFDGHGEEYGGGAWMDDDADQLSYSDMATGDAAASCIASNYLSFGGGGRSIAMGPMAAAASNKRPRAHAPSPPAPGECIDQEAAAAAPNKKQCGGNRRAATKPNKAPPKDPQNLVAKNRRERISERLRALQELVPNGSKVDTVTMLDKAITCVKFIQLQLKVLEADAFWPAPGGQAPDMSRVKEALDAILLSAPFS